MLEPVKAVVAVVGTPGAALAAALERFRARGAHVTGDLAAALPGRFRLAWIFADAADAGAPEVAAWHARLAAVAPVQLALHADIGAGGEEALARAGANFVGGVIVQPYDNAGLAQVAALIDDFLARG
ncbi:hypothetical protein [Massilia arenae]|uniref:Uncharacterized protein n=1 Tax=Massilia arenae TaxID=2603288 RepID=A0A5C7FS94_9BURK|nr:hypothetical protein [Massilia arenae]TXF97858.1 hypothetical protein FVD38_18875 [Massilia arenae]